MNMTIKLEDEDRRAIAREVATILEPILSSNSMNQTDQIFDVAGLAEYLTVGTDWVYKKVKDRSIPYTKVGKYNRFQKSDVDQWLANRTSHPLSTNPAQNVLLELKKRSRH